MGTRIEWSNLATNELKLIRAYIAIDSKYYANITVRKIREKVGMLAKFPEIGKIYTEKNGKCYREVIGGNFRIFYRYDKVNAQIRIVSVFHSSRDIDNLIM